MGNQKQKWTAEEEDALQRGVQKHGAGKWKNILKDPEFAASLTNRSNIDLKDKWRNLNVGNGQGSKDKSRTPKTKPIVPPPAPSPANATPATAPAPSPASVPTPQIVTPSPQSQSHSQSQSHHSSQIDHDVNIPPRYNAMIFEALATIKDTNGSDINAIVSFIEKKHKVPQNFRRALGSRLRRLVNQGKLEKVQNCYKIKKDTPLGTKSPAPKSPVLKQKDVWPQQSPASSFLTSNETFKDAADTAAYRVADAENKSFLASEAVKEVEKFSKMAEDIDSMLQLAQEVFEQCSHGEMIRLA